MAQRSNYRSSSGEQAVKAKYNDLMRHWPLQKDIVTLKTPLGNTQVVCCGDSNNPPLILLHGHASGAIRWLRDVEAFCKSHRIYALDIPGEANPSDNSRSSFKTTAHREWLEDVVQQLKLTQIALVGENLGAWICLQYAADHPEQITHLALLSPAGIVKTRRRFKIKSFFAFFLGPLGKKLLLKSIAKGADYEQKFLDYHNLVKKHFRLRRQNLPLLKDKALSQLYCPILLLLGKKDKVFSSDKILLRLAHCVPQLEVNVRPRDGHWLSTCTREVDRFLVTQYPAE